MHPQPRQRDRREWRDDPTRTNTSGRSHHVTVEAVRDAAHGVPVEGHRHSPPIRSRTGARSQTRTGTHALGACTRPGSLPELPPHTAPAPSPLSGAEKDSATAARIVAGSRRKESVRSRRRQRVRRRLAAHHAGVASSVRLSVSSLLAWMSLGEVEGVTKQVGERSYASADILVCRRQELNTLCMLLSCGASIPCWRPRRVGG